MVHVGKVDAAVYPLAKKKTSYEFLREKAHLRPRTNTIGTRPAWWPTRVKADASTHRWLVPRSMR